MTKTVDLNAIVVSGKALTRFTTETISQIAKLKVRLHQNACMTALWAAENGEFSQLNRFYNALAINDQTALRKWMIKHFTYIKGEGDAATTENWFTFSAKKDEETKVIKGFICKKGTEVFRKGHYTLDELLALDPFFTKDVSKPDVIDLAKLVEMLKSAGNRVAKQSDENGVELPADVTSVLAAIGKIADVKADNDDGKASRSNVA